MARSYRWSLYVIFVSLGCSCLYVPDFKRLQKSDRTQFLIFSSLYVFESLRSRAWPQSELSRSRLWSEAEGRGAHVCCHGRVAWVLIYYPSRPSFLSPSSLPFPLTSITIPSSSFKVNSHNLAKIVTSLLPRFLISQIMPAKAVSAKAQMARVEQQATGKSLSVP